MPALAGRPRDEFVLSTKVGRLVRPTTPSRRARTSTARRSTVATTPTTPTTTGRRVVFDYQRDGVPRSIEESLERLGLDRVDIAYIHDPDDHWQAAIGRRYPALASAARARASSGAIGVGMNQSAMLVRFARETDIDVFLLAGRYTLLDQDALPELLPLCLERGIAVLVGGVMNSGVLADPRPGASLRLRPGLARDPRRAPAARGSLRAPWRARCAPRRSSSRSPTPR